MRSTERLKCLRAQQDTEISYIFKSRTARVTRNERALAVLVDALRVAPKVRSRFRIMYAIASIFPEVRSRFRIMYAIGCIFPNVRSRFCLGGCDRLYLTQGAITLH
jgi:dsDNA-specific endonuclease/ATPase MutS2